MSDVTSANADIRPSIFDYSPEMLVNLCLREGWPAYTATQILKWVYQKRITDFNEMTNVKKAARARLADGWSFDALSEVGRQTSADGTVKYLFACRDGQTVESVAIPAMGDEAVEDGDGRLTLCVSTQVGCRMGCRFCLTAAQNKVRDLTLAEIVGQLMCVLRQGVAVTNVVFMGMGEPLDNYDAALGACQLLTHDLAFNFSHRRVTMSTCGLIPPLVRFMQASSVNVAISLHAPDDALRQSLMPIARAYPIDALMDALREFFPRGRKRITFEYVMLKGVNDTKAHARRLIKILHAVPAKINLIAFNAYPGAAYAPSDDDVVTDFMDTCCQSGIVTTRRQSRGADILAACGQLRSQTSHG